MPRSIAWLLLPCALGAADLQLNDGRVLRDYQVMSLKTGYMTVKHAEGIAQIERKLLPPEIAWEVPPKMSDEQTQSFVDSVQEISVSRSIRLERERTASLSLRFTTITEPARLLIVLAVATENPRAEDIDIVSISRARAEELDALLQRFETWRLDCQKKDIPAAKKTLGEIDGRTFQFTYEKGRACYIWVDGAFFSEDAVAAFRYMMQEVPRLHAEWAEQVARARRVVELD